jgi:hypothetical protein
MNTTPCLTDFANGADARKMLEGDAEPVSAAAKRSVKADGTLVGVNKGDERTVYRHGGALYIEDTEGDMARCAVEIRTSSCVIYLSSCVSTFLPSSDGVDYDCSKSLVEATRDAIGLLSTAPSADRTEIAIEMIHEAVAGGAGGRRGSVSTALQVMFADTDGTLINELHEVVNALVLREAANLNLFTGIRFNSSMNLEVLLGDFPFETTQGPACDAAAQVLIDAYGIYVATHGDTDQARVAGKTYTSVRESATKWVLEGGDGKQITTVTKNDDDEYNDGNGDEIETDLHEGNFWPPVATAKWAVPAPAKRKRP